MATLMGMSLQENPFSYAYYRATTAIVRLNYIGNDIIMDKNPTLKRIESYLKQNDWSLYKLAKESDLPYSSVNNLFQRNNEPSLFTVRKMCEGLGISVSEFFADDFVPARVEYTIDERELISLYRPLNGSDKKLLITYASALNHIIPQEDNE